MLSIPLLFAGCALFVVSRYVYRFITNYLNASKSGVPVIVVPVDQNNTLWMIFSAVLRPWMRKNLPSQLFSRIKYVIYGWEHDEKLRPFHACTTPSVADKAGIETSYFITGFGRPELWTSSRTLVQQILLRPRDFQQFDITSLFAGQYGPNLFTTDGDEWAKHRKMVASAITEKISPIVWAESAKQTEGLIREIKARPGAETRRIYDMMKTVTINVLSKAGMGTAKDWTPEVEAQPGNTVVGTSDVSYMDAVKLINDNMTGPVLMPTSILLNWPAFLPGRQRFRNLGVAKLLFPERTREMLNEEKERIAQSNGDVKENKINLMRMLITASDTLTQGSDETNDAKLEHKKPSLTDDELISNLYVFTVAGYDTTANTIAYAVTLLMRYPKWQDWILEEVDSLLDEASQEDGNASGEEFSNYQTIFPKCVRIMAFMLETLRLFPPLIHMAKMARETQTLIDEHERTVVLPAGTNIYISTMGLHLDAAVWRDLNRTSDDILKDWEDDMPGLNATSEADIELGGGKLGDEWRFRPTRWIKPDHTSAGQRTSEAIFQPPRGSFLPWSMGPRVCPGQKMAQVEFTAIMLTILSRHRIEAVPYNGEDANAVNQRLTKMIQNSISKVTSEMQDVYNTTDQEDSKSQSDPLAKKGLRVRLIERNSRTRT